MTIPYTGIIVSRNENLFTKHLDIIKVGLIMKQPKTELLNSEKVIRSSGGGPIKFLTGAKGGRLFLTNERLFHEPNIGKKKTFSIEVSDIADVKKARFSMLLMIIPIFKCIKVFLKDGSHTKLNVSDKDGWIVAIKEAIK